MVHKSNFVLGCVNVSTLIFSIFILCIGIVLSKAGGGQCAQWLVKPVIAVGVLIMVVSILGLFGVCFRNSILLWIYLVVMFFLIVFLLIFTIFTFTVTAKGAGEVAFGKAYKEYKLGNYSHWLQNRVISQKSWNTIKTCLQDSGICSDYRNKFAKDDSLKFFAEKKISPIQSGCCKPPSECNFSYESPTIWNKPGNANYTNQDCGLWDNSPKVLCFNCTSCKAGLLQSVKTNWRKASINNIVFVMVLIIAFGVGICAFKNVRKEEGRRMMV